MELKHYTVIQNKLSALRKYKKNDWKIDAKSHCRRKASPPYPLDASRLSKRRLNARRWLTPATLEDTKNAFAKRDRNWNPAQKVADVAMILKPGVGT